MSDALYYILSAVLVAGVLAGIAMMSKVQTAGRGNLLGAACMAAAILLTLWRADLLTMPGLWVSMAVGLALGALAAARVKMIQMPQAVALLNGFGGAASAIVGLMELMNPSITSVFSSTTAALALALGTLTLTGSLVAAAKLHGVMGQRPTVLPGHTVITLAFGLLTLLLIVLAVLFPTWPIALLCILISGAFGWVFAIRVGGADMPITISLLNSFSGVAAGIAGLAIADPLLVAIGGVVGASGLLLTQIMCRAMNRRLLDILLGATSIPAGQKATQAAPTARTPADTAPRQDGIGATATGTDANTTPAPPSTASTAQPTPDIPPADSTQPDASPQSTPAQDAPPQPAPDPVQLLREARSVIIVPGYGMALAQAQEEVKRLCDLLEAGGAQVRFAIHPVAGRMPGHMNVLLAEVDVPYEQLYEMDDINPEFENCDVCVVIGANDVVNPAANTAEGTPIYGMPVLDVENSRHLIIMNFDTKPGYAGVDNPLYTRAAGVTLMLGDAKETVARLIEACG